MLVSRGMRKLLRCWICSPRTGCKSQATDRCPGRWFWLRTQKFFVCETPGWSLENQRKRTVLHVQASKATERWGIYSWQQQILNRRAHSATYRVSTVVGAHSPPHLLYTQRAGAGSFMKLRWKKMRSSRLLRDRRFEPPQQRWVALTMFWLILPTLRFHIIKVVREIQRLQWYIMVSCNCDTVSLISGLVNFHI